MRKLRVVFATVAMSAMMCFAQAAEGDFAIGDVDCDGKVGDITDVVLVGKHLAGRLTLSENSQNYKNANCNLDGEENAASVNIDDLKLLIDYMLGAVDVLPYPEGSGEPDEPTPTTTLATTTSETTTSETTTPALTTIVEPVGEFAPYIDGMDETEFADWGAHLKIFLNIGGFEGHYTLDTVSTDLVKVVQDGVTQELNYVEFKSLTSLEIQPLTAVDEGTLDIYYDGIYMGRLFYPGGEAVTGTAPPAPTTTSTTTRDPNQVADPTAYMQTVRSVMTNNVPSNATATPSQRGKVDNISYYCDYTGKTKKANVVLPVGYTTDKKYPVMYVNHGIMGSENDMLSDDMGVRIIAENLARTGEAEEMIIVCANMFTSKTMNGPAGFDEQTVEGYDNFLYDLTDSLMPYIEANYSVATGRENTAITGFSMGGREAIYIGLMRPDLFGYIGGACPAPGIVAASDAFMSHTGSMSESEFKFKDGDPLPYVFMITGGTNDTVVGDFPQQYHNLLTQNGVDHIWQEIQGGGHGGNSVVPHMYNFVKAAFKA